MTPAPPRPDAWGVLPHFTQGARTVTTTPETTRALLDAMHADAPRPPIDRVITVRRGRSLHLPGAVEVVTEEGTNETLRGERIPRDLPLGYHRVAWRDGSAPSRLIVSPGVCHLPHGLRTWGWALQLYALRSRASWGMGDLGDLARFAAWARSTGAGMTLINPLHAVTPGTPQQASPYYPGSRVWRNPLYLDIQKVPGANEAGVALERLARAGKDLNNHTRIDRDEIYRLKMKALEVLWSRFPRDDRAFALFRERHRSLLEDYSTFAAVSETIGRDQRSWGPGLDNPRGREVARFRAEHSDRVSFHAWLQWLLNEQLASVAREGGLVQDLAVGVDPAGADAWVWRNVFARDVTVGAPPDAFNAHGQDWGALAFDPWKLAAEEYDPFIQTVRFSMARGGGLRLDHVMGLWRLYWVPAGSSPAHGGYVGYPAATLLDIVALESARANCYVIGEDLGTVDPQVTAEMTERKMLSCNIFWFEDTPPVRYPKRALAAVTNHDLPTVAGLWSGDDLEVQRSLGLDPDEEAHEALRRRIMRMTSLNAQASDEEAVRAVYALLAEAPSALLAANPEDALTVRKRQNHPGTRDEWPNWSLALPRLLEELTEDPSVLALVERLASTR